MRSVHVHNMKPIIFKPTILILMGILTTCQSWRTFKIIIEDSSLEFDERLINMSIEVSSDYGNNSLLNVYVTVLQDIDNLMADMTLTAKTANEEQFNVLNAKGNFCRFLVGRKDGNIRLIFDKLQKFGKIWLECPIRKGSYYLQDLKIDPELAPDYLPEATFLATGHLYVNDINGVQQSILKVNLTGKIDKSQGLDSIKVFSMG